MYNNNISHIIIKLQGGICIIIKKFKDVDIIKWRKKFGLAEWRELNYEYLKMLDSLSMQPFEIIETNNYIIPFLNTNKENTLIDTIMKSFVNIFTDSFQISLSITPVLFLFMPTKVNDFELEYLLKDINKFLYASYRNHKNMFFYNQKNYKDLFFGNNIISKVVSYNTCICSAYKDIYEYNGCLKSKDRNFINSVILSFKNSNLVFKKFDLSFYKERVWDLYKSNCKKYGEIPEPIVIWERLTLLKNVDWYGIFNEKNLIMFLGYWREDNSVILSMFGKDYNYETQFRETKAYFFLNFKLIEIALKNKVTTLYNGYGAKEIKSQFGYEILNYAISILE